MAKKLARKFYVRPALVVARDLLGKYIIRKTAKEKLIGKIVETEAYIGPKDKASHAYLPYHLRKIHPNGKKTKRNAAEYLIGGNIYIYLVYGMYWQFNVSTGEAGIPECALIRAIEPVLDEKQKLKIKRPIEKIANGPGKLCQYLKLDKSFYGEDLIKSERIWLEDGNDAILKKNIVSGPRVGIDYAGSVWAKKPWRFWIKNSKFVSKT